MARRARRISTGRHILKICTYELQEESTETSVQKVKIILASLEKGNCLNFVSKMQKCSCTK